MIDNSNEETKDWKLSPDDSPAYSSEHGVSNGTRRKSRSPTGKGLPSVWMRLPNTSFGIPMGIAGHAIMWKAAGNAEFISEKANTQIISAVFWIASLLVMGLLFTAYCLKAYFYFPLVRDEYHDAMRVHFLNMPHLILLMLAICVPYDSSGITMIAENGGQGRRIIFGIGFLMQLLLTQQIYENWLFSDTQNISCARPQFFLSTVGWYFLAVLGTETNVEQTWGIALPTFCFGFGMMMYLIVTFAIFNGIHTTPQSKGTPALFLFLAPPSVGVVAWDLINAIPGEFPILSKLILGWCLGVFVMLVKMGPQIVQPPATLGHHWAYVFSMSALATATISYAGIETNGTTIALAYVFIALAILALTIVLIRMSVHAYQVFIGKADWEDPLLTSERLASIRPAVDQS
jgi:tellurite resistance protein TehA-like permease